MFLHVKSKRKSGRGLCWTRCVVLADRPTCLCCHGDQQPLVALMPVLHERDCGRDGTSWEKWFGAWQTNKYTVAVSSVVCDALARVFRKRIKGHSGYSACDKCTQPDLYINEMTFPDVDEPIRTNVTCYEMGDNKHYKGPGSFWSPNRRYDNGIAFALGVMQRLLRCWMKGPLACCLAYRTKYLISRALLSLSNIMPGEFMYLYCYYMLPCQQPQRAYAARIILRRDMHAICTICVFV